MTREAVTWVLDLLRGTSFIDVLGADGKTYSALAKNGKGSASTTPWAISFISTTSVSISIPVNIFSISSGTQPIITVGGNPADYVIAKNNVLTVPEGRSFILLKCTVDDDPLYALHTSAVEVIALNEADNAALVNTLTTRYIHLAGIDSVLQQSSNYVTTAIRTIRVGDRKNIASMHFYVYS